MLVPRAVELRLSNEEPATLRAWARRPKTAQSLALRSRIVLICAEGRTNGAVAEELGATWNENPRPFI